MSNPDETARGEVLQGEAAVHRNAAQDRFTLGLGVELVESLPERVTLRLRITEAHLNFYGFCHGGVIFSLADTAFGLASNAHGQVAVAIDAHATFTTAVRAGETLTARATELSRTRRTGTYRVEVRNDAGELVSQFTGTVHRMDKPAEG